VLLRREFHTHQDLGHRSRSDGHIVIVGDHFVQIEPTSFGVDEEGRVK
jgi:hypothetical protein